MLPHDAPAPEFYLDRYLRRHSMSVAQVQIWLFIIMRWQELHLARICGKALPFHERETHWWIVHLYQKQRKRSGLINWLDCLASWYTPNFNLCILRVVELSPGFWQFREKTNAITPSLVYNEGTNVDGSMGKWQYFLCPWLCRLQFPRPGHKRWQNELWPSVVFALHACVLTTFVCER